MSNVSTDQRFRWGRLLLAGLIGGFIGSAIFNFLHWVFT